MSCILSQNLKLFNQEKLYNLTADEIEEMNEYVKTNDIYMHVENVSTPKGIKIKNTRLTCVSYFFILNI